MNQSQQQSKRKKRYTFTLKNIDIHKIDKKYDITLSSNLDQTCILPPNSNITKIDELNSRDTFFHSFIDESKKHCITMLDSITKGRITSNYCFWCRHHFLTTPIGCPINYVPSKITQTLVSDVSKEQYYIYQDITSKQRENVSSEFNTKINEYYETDGSFCSFNCCLSYIQDNIHKPIYSNSKYLLTKMYADLYGVNEIKKINPAPSWRLLREYGGFMDIQEFRDSFTNYIYIDNKHCISELPKIHPIGHVYEEHYIF